MQQKRYTIIKMESIQGSEWLGKLKRKQNMLIRVNNRSYLKIQHYSNLWKAETKTLT